MATPGMSSLSLASAMRRDVVSSTYIVAAALVLGHLLFFYCVLFALWKSGSFSRPVFNLNDIRRLSIVSIAWPRSSTFLMNPILSDQRRRITNNSHSCNIYSRYSGTVVGVCKDHETTYVQAHLGANRISFGAGGPTPFQIKLWRPWKLIYSHGMAWAHLCTRSGMGATTEPEWQCGWGS